MKSDLEIARYNTSKKLSQLNKVIQYLSYHLQDRIYQVVYFKKKYEEQEMEIINGIDDKIRPIFENLNESRIEIEEQTNKFYQNKLSTMRAALDARLKAATNEVQTKMSEVEKEIGNSFTTLEIINSSLEEQLSILKDKSKFDVTSLKIKITQMTKDHQFEMKKRDGESRRKIKSVEDEFQKKVKELELQHKDEIDQLKGNTNLNSLSIPSNLKQPFINSKERIKNLQKFIQNQIAEMNKQKEIFQKNMSSYREKFKKIISNYPKTDKIKLEDIEKLKKGLEQKYLQMQNRIESLRSELNFKKQNYENEMATLEKELNQIRGSINNQKEEKEKTIELTKKKSNNELFTFIQSLNDERNKLKLKNQRILNKQEEIIKRIQSDIDNFDEDHSNEFVLLKEEKESHLTEFEQENKKIKTDFQNRMYNEVKKFNELKSNFEVKIKHTSSQSAEFAKRDDEYKKLKIVLESLNRSIESNMKNLAKNTNEDLTKFKNEKNQELETSKLKLNCNFEVAEHKRKADITAYQKELDVEYSLKQTEIEKDSKEKIDQIQTEFLNQKEIELNELNIEYEKKFNSIENELNSVIIPDEIIELTDQSINDLKIKLENLPGEVTEERNSIVSKFEQSIDEEEERHRQLLLSYLAYCNESQERDYESCFTEQKKRISLFEGQIKELDKEFKRIVNMSLKLAKFDSEDLEQIRLEEELSRVRQEMKAKIRNEENIKNDLIKEATQKILQQQEENEKNYKEENDKQRKESKESHNLFDEQRNRRRKISENSVKNLKEEENNFRNLLENRKIENNEKLVELKRAIINVRQKAEDENESFEERLLKERRRLEKENKLITDKFPDQIKLLKDGIEKMHPELDRKILEMTERRDKAKLASLNKPMRKEEISIIKRLEGQLSVTTSHLTAVGRDLLQYRQQLISQEGEYNVRFGADRSVAIMKPSKRRPTTTMATKRLPKLCNFDSTQNSY